MCDPISIGVALSVGASAAGAIQAQGAADAANEYQEIIHTANEANAHEAAIQELTALNDRQAQLRASSAQTIAQIGRDSRSAEATARVNVLEGGGGGQSATALLRDFERQEVSFQQNAVDNLIAQEGQLQRERFGVRAREQQRIASTIPHPVQGPFDSPLGILSTVLNVGAAGFSAGSQIGAAGQAGAAGV